MNTRLPDGKGFAGLPAAPADPQPAQAADVPTLESGDLFALGKTVRIRHQGQTYFLRLTRENKLILTK